MPRYMRANPTMMGIATLKTMTDARATRLRTCQYTTMTKAPYTAAAATCPDGKLLSTGDDSSRSHVGPGPGHQRGDGDEHARFEHEGDDQHQGLAPALPGDLHGDRDDRGHGDLHQGLGQVRTKRGQRVQGCRPTVDEPLGDRLVTRFDPRGVGDRLADPDPDDHEPEVAGEEEAEVGPPQRYVGQLRIISIAREPLGRFNAARSHAVRQLPRTGDPETSSRRSMAVDPLSTPLFAACV